MNSNDKSLNAVTGKVADAAADNWVDQYAPGPAKPYLRLARVDRPIGKWLLLLPCWFGLALAAAQGYDAPFRWYAGLLMVGAIAMRGAGCTYNDIIDRDIDAKVERTALRPIPSGAVSTRQAWIFLAALCAIGLLVLLQFNRLSILLGIGSLGLVAAYPFMKRITWWPQAWLGLTFNGGALLSYAAVTNSISVSAIILYIACFFWTLAYDTIYAHQDKEDDALIGVKSSARALGARTKPIVAGLLAIVVGLFAVIGIVNKFNLVYFVALAGPAMHFYWQVHTLDIDNPLKCLEIFKSNRDAGFILLAVLLLEFVIASTT